MLKSAVVFVILLSANTTIMFMVEGAEEKEDFMTFDYCKLNCQNAKHSACNCKMRAPRIYNDDGVVEYRQAVLDKHNTLRNMVASGNESHEILYGKTASNMMVINYDLELEYIAKCFGGYYTYGHDSCRRTVDKAYVGQNLAGTGNNYSTAHRDNMERWYNEVKLIDQEYYMFPHFNGTTPIEGLIYHFTQFIWATTTHVGCARIWNPKNEANGGAWRYTMLCNYRALKGKSMNAVGQLVFKLGAPCSECPSGMTCNDKYTSLCGKLEPVPTGPGRAKGSERLVSSRIISLCALVVLLYFC
jgi:hypothetical protein